jgi:hypothetical protein
MRITFHDGVVAASVEGAPLVKSTAKEATS